MHRSCWLRTGLSRIRYWAQSAHITLFITRDGNKRESPVLLLFSFHFPSFYSCYLGFLPRRSTELINRWDEWVPEARLLKLNEAGFNKRKQLADQQTQKSRSIGVGGASPAIKEKGKGKKGGETKKRARDSGIESVRLAPPPHLFPVSSNPTKADLQESEYIQKPEVKIVIPDVLKLQLVDDWENVTKNNQASHLNCMPQGRELTNQLVTLPRNPNVRQLLEDYRIHVNSTKKSQDRTPYVPFPFPLQHQYQKANRDADIRRATALLSEIIAGITLYFDKALGNNLLYRFERAQYVEQKRENPDKPMSEMYGAEHLLRLFGEFCSEVLIPSSESWIGYAMKT